MGPEWADLLSIEDVERLIVQRYERDAQLAAWIVSTIPSAIALALGVAFGGDVPVSIESDWKYEDLLARAPRRPPGPETEPEPVEKGEEP